jgi:starvation-inducible outer membrane lipoprotein
MIMKKALFIFSLVLLVSGCTSIPNTKLISWEKLPKDKLVQVCQTKNNRISGCARISFDICRIYTWEDDPDENELLGHELKHCFLGRYHK